MAVLEHMPIKANDSERPALDKIRGVLNDKRRVPRLVGPDNESIELPQSIFQVLKQIVSPMMQGRAIFIIPDNKELTSQEAAEFLQVSRPYLIRLLEEKKIPYSRVGSHRRIRFSDLINFKKQREAEQEQALDEIAQMSQDLGMYD